MSRLFNSALLKTFFSTAQCLPNVSRTTGNVILRRNYLTPAYQCLEAWNKRHDEEIVKMVGKPGDFFIMMLQKKKTEYMLYAHDIDLYLHSLDTDGGNWSPQDVEELLSQLRPCNEAYKTLPSTHHTTLRLLLHNNCTESLFRILSQPEIYGIFMDNHVANLMMDHYLVQKDYSMSARVACHLMLVEDYGSSLNQQFALFSCLQYATNIDSSSEWQDYKVVEPEPEDDVLIRADYYPNSYFDDHFHLRDGVLLAGKTLAWCARSCLPKGAFRTNCMMLGWAMYRKWETLATFIDRVKSGKEDATVAATVVSLARGHVEQHCEDEEKSTRLLAALDSLTLTQDYDLVAAMEKALTESIKQQETEQVQAQEQMYKDHAQGRLDALRKMKEEYYRRELVKEIKEKKQHLKRKRQLLYYFDNEERLDFFLSRMGKFEHPFPRKRPPYKARGASSTADNYIPPLVMGRKITQVDTSTSVSDA